MRNYLLPAIFAASTILMNSAYAGFVAPTLKMYVDGSISAFYQVENQKKPYEVNFKKIEDQDSLYNKVLIQVNDLYVKPDSQFIDERRARYVEYGDHYPYIFEGNPENNNILHSYSISCVECAVSITYNFEDLNIKKILFTIDQLYSELGQLINADPYEIEDYKRYAYIKMYGLTYKYNDLLTDKSFFSKRTNKSLVDGIDYFYGACDFSTDPNCSRYGYSYGETANVEEVPLPAAAWLFGSALIGLYSRKK